MGVFELWTSKSSASRFRCAMPPVNITAWPRKRAEVRHGSSFASRTRMRAVYAALCKPRCRRAAAERGGIQSRDSKSEDSLATPRPLQIPNPPSPKRKILCVSHQRAFSDVPTTSSVPGREGDRAMRYLSQHGCARCDGMATWRSSGSLALHGWSGQGRATLH